MPAQICRNSQRLPAGRGAYYPNNQVPVDPNGPAMLVLIPDATSGSGTSSVYPSGPAQLTTNREELFRIDHVVNDKIRGFYRFIYDSWATVSAAPTFQDQSVSEGSKQFCRSGDRHGGQSDLQRFPVAGE